MKLATGPTNPTSATIPLDPRTYDRALSCVHCGLCLPACPTYTETQNEADSPRGRIQLMRGLAEGAVNASPSVRIHLDLCLDCRACETACPSGVVYHELIEETRARLSKGQPMSFGDHILRWLFFHVFVYRTRLKLALLPARILQKMGLYSLLRKSGLLGILSPSFQKLEQLLPTDGPLWPKSLPPKTPDRRARFSEHVDPEAKDVLAEATTPLKPTPRIGFFAGCIGSVLFNDVNQKAVDLLSASGAVVLAPHAQACCGAIHHHNGEPHPAENFARKNIDAFLPENGEPVDFITTTIAGCGAMLRDYATLLRDDPNYAQRAQQFADKVRDISEVLIDLGLPELKFPVNETITYHDACHLAHAQKVTAAPRALLNKIPGLKLIPLPESDMCCGAAGTYNLTQPQMAAQLADRKLNHIASTHAPICATGNAGCAMHLQATANQKNLPLKIIHPITLLHRAAFGPPTLSQHNQPKM